jgi:hypothetical protein
MRSMSQISDDANSELRDTPSIGSMFVSFVFDGSDSTQLLIAGIVTLLAVVVGLWWTIANRRVQRKRRCHVANQQQPTESSNPSRDAGD